MASFGKVTQNAVPQWGKGVPLCESALKGNRFLTVTEQGRKKVVPKFKFFSGKNICSKKTQSGSAHFNQKR
jgi:hypothetical protein